METITIVVVIIELLILATVIGGGIWLYRKIKQSREAMNNVKDDN